MPWMRRWTMRPAARIVGQLFGVKRLGRQLANLADGLMTVETPAPGIEAEFFNAVQLFGTASFESILRCGHGLQLSC